MGQFEQWLNPTSAQFLGAMAIPFLVMSWAFSLISSWWGMKKKISSKFDLLSKMDQ